MQNTLDLNKLLHSIRKYDPAGVGVYPDDEEPGVFVEYETEVASVSHLSDDAIEVALIDAISTNYYRPVDTFLVERVRFAIEEAQQ